MMAGTSALLIVIGAGAAGVAALTKHHKDAPQIVTAVGQAAPEAAKPAPEQALGRPVAPQKPVPHAAVARRATQEEQADRTGTRAPRAAATKPAPARPAVPAGPPPAADSPAGPVTTTRTDVETREIPFQTRLVRDPSLPRGTKQVQTQGEPGEETVRYLVTLVDGKQTARQLLDTTVTKEPQHRVVAFGTARGRGRGPHGGDCGHELRFCVPLGRRSSCHERKEESALQLGGSVVVLDQDIELLDAETLTGMPGVTC